MKFGKTGTGSFRLRLSRDRRLSYPDCRQQDRTFPAGTWVCVDSANCQWPGKPLKEGTVGWFVEVGAGREPVSDRWSFWDSCDPDTASIFGADDVAQLEAPDSPEWRDVFAGAPFSVKFVGEAIL